MKPDFPTTLRETLTYLVRDAIKAEGVKSEPERLAQHSEAHARSTESILQAIENLIGEDAPDELVLEYENGVQLTQINPANRLRAALRRKVRGEK